MKPDDIQRLRRVVRAKVDALPQRAVINEHDARFWVEEVVDKYGELALWHAARAAGFGGSQIGALVRNHLGLRADHSSAHDIVEGALLRRIPDEPNEHMARGVWAEPHHRELFYAKWTARRDEEGFKRLSESTGVRPWMRYSPDELCFMPGAVLGVARPWVRVLADFKAPTEAGAVNFEYQCQLGMGSAICKHVGVVIDALMLSQLDWAHFPMRDEWVAMDEELERHIILAGDHYWNEFVMKGMVPPYVLKPRLDPSGDIVQQVMQSLTDLSKLKALATYVGKRVEELEEQVKPKLAELRFGGAKLQVGGISYFAIQEIDMSQVRESLPEEVLAAVPLKKESSKRCDEDLLVAALKQAVPGINLRPFLKLGNLDGEALHAVLREHGHDPDAMVKEKLTSRVDKTVAEQTHVWAEGQVEHLLLRGVTRAADLNSVNGLADDEEDDREGQSSLRHVPLSRS
jgi:hypothetical protein